MFSLSLLVLLLEFNELKTPRHFAFSFFLLLLVLSEGEERPKSRPVCNQNAEIILPRTLHILRGVKNPLFPAEHLTYEAGGSLGETYAVQGPQHPNQSMLLILLFAGERSLLLLLLKNPLFLSPHFLHV